jgi:hypothetical protein
MNPAFAAAEAEALAEGYAWLEAEALRLGLETQQRLRAAAEAPAVQGARHVPGTSRRKSPSG